MLTVFYTIGTLEPSEVILLMAGAQPNKATVWDTAPKPRPQLRGIRDQKTALVGGALRSSM